MRAVFGLGVVVVLAAAAAACSSPIPPMSCTSDVDCLAGRFCGTAGTCVSECVAASDCQATHGAGATCDGRGRCVAALPDGGPPPTDAGLDGGADAPAVIDAPAMTDVPATPPDAPTAPLDAPTAPLDAPTAPRDAPAALPDAPDASTSCTAGGTRPCGVGACAGTQSCTGGSWGTCSGAAPGAETCNGIDDDCDGVGDASDPNVAMVGSACGNATGTCRPGTYSCPATTLVCGGAGYVGPVGETCDHRDEDCDGNRDDGVRASDCSRDLSSSSGAWCTPSGSCAAILSGGRYHLGAATLSATQRAAYLGGAAVDMSATTTVSATLDVGTCTGGASCRPDGRVALVLSTVRAVGTSTTRALPSGAGVSGYALAATTATGNTWATLELYRLTSTGPVRVGTMSTAAGSCFLSSTLRTHSFSLSVADGVVTGRVSEPGCAGDRTVTFSDPTWSSAMYGESASYPRYYAGATVDDRGAFMVDLTTLSLARTASTSRGHCVACP